MLATTRTWAGVLLLGTVTAAHAQTAASPAAPAGTIAHTWTPVRDGGADVVAIDVRTVISGLAPADGRTFSLAVPITYAGVPGIAERTESLTVRDPGGAVPLRVENDAADPGGFPFYRHFRATRAVAFPVVVTYRALTPRTPPRGPPFGLFSAWGGVSGSGAGFLVLPEYDHVVTSTVHWDLSGLAPGASAVSSFGEGDFTLVGAPSALQQGWIMAGPLHRYPASGGSGIAAGDVGSGAASGAASGFSASWLGTPAWDADAEMRWASRMFAWLGTSYAYLHPLPSYRVFIRVGTGRGATALANSFMVNAAPRGAGAAPAGESPRETFTHEMGHLFVGGIEAPDGVSSWFSEGLNVYYTRLLPMRGGFTSVQEYGDSVNAAFRDYWYGAARNFSADSITRIGFNDETVRHMPYVRGSLYFADLDAKIRARSHGRRNLDVVMRELFERRAQGVPITHASWKATVAREAGPSAPDDFEHIILRGNRTLVPASDAFGSCFARRATPPTTVDGKPRPAGYEWVRMASIPDAVCRKGTSQ